MPEPAPKIDSGQQRHTARETQDRQEGVTAMGRKRALLNASESSSRAAAIATRSPAIPAPHARRHFP